MSVAAHLNIRSEEYDSRIRTFVPWYEEMISTAAEALKVLQKKSPTILDLGVGTDELAARCLTIHHDASLVGIDIDQTMLEVAQKRLQRHSALKLVAGDFRQVPFPRCDAIVACIALHHIKTPEEKKALYRQCALALQPGGLFVSADCFPAREERLARKQRESWLAHMAKTYSHKEAEAYLASWADEDFYAPLSDELQWLKEAGFVTEVLWRRDAFAVLVGNLP